VPFILFNKPYHVLSQFSDRENRPVLADFIAEHSVYPAGRLDYDSEGLLLLTDDGRLQARISAPEYRLTKHYQAQVEGDATAPLLQRLLDGVSLKDGIAHAVGVERIAEPEGLWPRTPPIRERLSIPTDWIELVINEGRNRQVRRMTAAVGLPTLRLIRQRIGPWDLGTLAPGDQQTMTNRQAWRQLGRQGQERIA